MPSSFWQEPVKRRGERGLKDLATELTLKAVQNTHWRQKESFNLIPSEQTPSLLVKFFSMMDPPADTRSTENLRPLRRKRFITTGDKMDRRSRKTGHGRVSEFSRLLGNGDKGGERPDGQYGCLQRINGLSQPPLSKERPPENQEGDEPPSYQGGHLSAQPMGALRDYVAVDPLMERAAVIEFPVLADDPYQIDLKKTRDQLEIKNRSSSFLERA